MIAFTRAVPRSIADCELTHLERECIDLGNARAQHERYEAALRAAGAEVVRLPARDSMPDSVFVEDTAIVFDEVAILTRPGAESRRGEVESVRDALAEYRALETIEAPGTIDGGDVLVLDHDVFVGLTPRSNGEGVEQLQSLLAPFGYRVRGVPVHGCLHLKSAVTRAGLRAVVANPAFVDPTRFEGWEVIPVDPSEPYAGNVLWLGDHTIVAESFVRTNARLARETDSVLLPVPASELAKAEGGVTCCSLIVR